VNKLLTMMYFAYCLDDILYWIQGTHFVYKLVHQIMARYELLIVAVCL